MKKWWTTTVLIVLACGTAALRAESPSVLTSLAQIHALTNPEASRQYSVDFQATVTYYRDYERTLFVQDGDTAVYVQTALGLRLHPGDRVRVRGTTHESFRPFVMSKSVERIGHGPMPAAVAASFDDLIHARYDCRLVKVRAVVRTADVANFSAKNARMQFSAEGGTIDATLDSNDEAALRSLLDADVEVTGVSSGRFDGKMQQTGVLLHITSVGDIQVIKRAVSDPWSLPLSPMDEILSAYHVVNLTHRVRVRGAITYYQPGSAVVLQSGTKSLWLATQTRDELRVGDIADATGIPDVHDGFLRLTKSEIKDSGTAAPVAAHELTWGELTRSHHLFDLVSIQGQVVMEARESSQDEYILTADGNLFSAIVRHPVSTYASQGAPPLPAMREIPLGSTVTVTGICILEDSQPFDATVPFHLMMRTADDIEVLSRPSWKNVRTLMIVTGILLLVLFALGLRGWSLEHRIRRQNAVAAYVERMRGSVLEDISRARPLSEIVTKVTQLLSFNLRGAPCWCELEGGVTVGRCCEASTHLEIIQLAIPSHSGKALGTLFAGIDPDRKLKSIAQTAIANAAQLASLAIETGGLYADLVYRSQYDLLTEIHNRFALGKRLEGLIDAGRPFGLIYVDLNDFKQVNDHHGHRIGDLYLQEVALRMKRLLRPDDMLARLGGDEFAVVVPAVHNRAELEEITLRMERCFDEPFLLDGNLLRGTASIGMALYPENGGNQDALLSAADAAMYRAKGRYREARGYAAPAGGSGRQG